MFNGYQKHEMPLCVTLVHVKTDKGEENGVVHCIIEQDRFKSHPRQRVLCYYRL